MNRHSSTNQSLDPLSELRDVALPPQPGHWDLALGWWALLAVLLSFIFYFAYLGIRHWRSNRYRREALAELESITDLGRKSGNDQFYLKEIQELLKRVALTKFSREKVAQLSQLEWTKFLDRSSNSERFSEKQAEALIDGAYRKEMDMPLDIDYISGLALFWIKNHQSKYIKGPSKSD